MPLLYSVVFCALLLSLFFFFFFSSRRRHTRFDCDWSSDVCSSDLAQRLLEQYGLRFSEGYGLTETAAPTHSNPFEHPKQQCLGIPFMSTEARVIDPETGADVPQGEQGEIGRAHV